MQFLQANSEASSQTYFSFPPLCTREMVRKSSNSIGTIDGLSYQEYFDNPHNVVLTASPRRLTRLISKPEELVYKVSSVFDLDEENEVEISERQYTEEPEEISSKDSQCKEEENENTDMCIVEDPSTFKDSDKLDVSNTSSIGFQGYVARNEISKDTLLKNGCETQTAEILPKPPTDDARVISSETAAPSGSDQSIVSSMKVEVGSQDTIKVNCTNSSDLVSFIDSSVVSKPLAQAHSEGKCKKKKKTSRSLKGVSKSVPHVGPEEMQQVTDFSRIITQEELYAEMSRGDDAFNSSLDQFDEDSSYSSESEDDDDSMTGSNETVESTTENNSARCYQAPMVSPASPMTSQNTSESILPSEVHSDSEITLQTVADNQSEHEGSLDMYCSANSESTLQFEVDSQGETEKTVNEQISAKSEITTEYDSDSQNVTRKLINTCMKLPPSTSSSSTSRKRSPSPKKQLEETNHILPKSVESSNNPSPQNILSGSSSAHESESPMEERECKSKRLEKLVEKLCQDFVANNPAVKQNPPTIVPYFGSDDTDT